MKPQAKIAFVDIETAPSLGYVWGKWEQNVIEFKTDWYMLSYAVKWVGESKVHTRGLIDYPGYRKDMEDDGRLVADLWDVFDKADILVAHNGDGFDIVKANTRFILHELRPPSPYKTVDTLKIARKVFKFDSNKLDELGQYFGVGRKLPHTGFNLWRGCMLGDKKSWDMMKRYNGHDVELLEKIYYLMQAWAPTHPNVNRGDLEACPKCGSKHVQRRGFSYTLLRQKQRYNCQDCHGWFEGSARKVE
jgi:uncharacterized protein YprB with RNaseH-like and TPR domain/predicted RNA-binding Zn-ribbon protein involved in translation (DUF1610 family)